MMLHFYPVCVFCYGKRPGRKAPGPVPLRGPFLRGSSPFYARPDLPLLQSSASCLDLTCAIKMIKSAFPRHKVKRISEAGRFALCCLFSSGRGLRGHRRCPAGTAQASHAPNAKLPVSELVSPLLRRDPGSAPPRSFWDPFPMRGIEVPEP